jgi:hypothetical protein
VAVPIVIVDDPIAVMTLVNVALALIISLELSAAIERERICPTCDVFPFKIKRS